MAERTMENATQVAKRELIEPHKNDKGCELGQGDRGDANAQSNRPEQQENKYMTAQVESSRRRVACLSALSIYILLWFGCASSDVVPDSLEPQIDKTLTFGEILMSPDAYRGRSE